MADPLRIEGPALSAPSSRRIPWRALIAAAAALPPLALLAAEAFVFDFDWTFPLDDSYIHLVFARSLAAGQGLAFNPGELVAGTTAPLWTALVGLLSLLPGNTLLWVKLAGGGLHVASALAAFALARRLALSPPRAAVAALLVAWTDWLVWSAPSGMEVPLFTALSLAGVARHLDERRDPALPPLSFVVLALAALARPEGLLLPLLAAADRTLRFQPAGEGLRLRRPDFRAVGIGAFAAALVILPTVYVQWRISGSVFPTTLAAKSSGPAMLVPHLAFLRAVLGIAFASQPWTTLLALGGAVEAFRRLGSERDRGLLLPLWLLALPVGSAMLSSGKEIAVGNFGRYFFPLLPVVVVLGALALDAVPFHRLRRLSGIPIGGLALLVLLAPAVTGLVKAAGRYLTSCANVRASDVAVARWLEPRLDPEAVLAVNDIGAIKYLLPNRVIDLVGIVTPEVTRRRLQGAREGKSYQQVLAEFLEERRPDLVVVFPSWFGVPEREATRFRRLFTLAIPDNITMGGDMIAVYATPWMRRPLAEADASGRRREDPR